MNKPLTPDAMFITLTHVEESSDNESNVPDTVTLLYLKPFNEEVMGDNAVLIKVLVIAAICWVVVDGFVNALVYEPLTFGNPGIYVEPIVCPSY